MAYRCQDIPITVNRKIEHADTSNAARPLSLLDILVEPVEDIPSYVLDISRVMELTAASNLVDTCKNPIH